MLMPQVDDDDTTKKIKQSKILLTVIFCSGRPTVAINFLLMFTCLFDC